ncbi:type II secretion system protein J [Candidatus Margulisiibacteriota bacterium]
MVSKKLLEKLRSKKKGQRGLTLMEVILALAIAIFIFELVFYVYMSLFRSWDIGFMRGKVEDEAQRVVTQVSKELRGASANIVLSQNNPTWLSFRNQQDKVVYLYNPETSYIDFSVGNYVTKNAMLKTIRTNVLNENNYGEGAVIAKDLVPPSGAEGGTRFKLEPTGLIRIQVVSRAPDTALTLNAAVYSRNL